MLSQQIVFAEVGIGFAAMKTVVVNIG